MTDMSVSAAIARHIEELEVALRHVANVMDPALGKEAGRIIARKLKEFGWAGEVDEELDPVSWLAPSEWRIAGGANDDFDLFINFEGTDCIDGKPPETWVGQFLGFAGAGMHLAFGSNSLGRAKWKSLLREQAELIDQLARKGFKCDAKDGLLVLPVQIDKSELISGFEEENISKALRPLEIAIDRVREAKPLFDKLVKAIRAKAA